MEALRACWTGHWSLFGRLIRRPTLTRGVSWSKGRRLIGPARAWLSPHCRRGTGLRPLAFFWVGGYLYLRGEAEENHNRAGTLDELELLGTLDLPLFLRWEEGGLHRQVYIVNSSREKSDNGHRLSRELSERWTDLEALQLLQPR